MADLDGDGRPELVSGGTGAKVLVFPGLGTGLLGRARELLTLDRTIDWGASDTSVVVVDWDGDGVLDLLVGTRTGKVYLLRNSATRGAVALQSGGKDLKVDGFAAPCAGDWDGDGDLDLLVGDHGGGVWLFQRSDGRLRLAEPLVEREDDPHAGPQEYAHPALADWNGDGRIDLLVGDHWVETRPPRERTAAEAQELDARFEELRILEGRIGGARQRLGDELCSEMGLDWRELWKLEGDVRTRYYGTLEARLGTDQQSANARKAIEHVSGRVDELAPPSPEHGRVWVFLREAR